MTAQHSTTPSTPASTPRDLARETLEQLRATLQSEADSGGVLQGLLQGLEVVAFGERTACPNYWVRLHAPVLEMSVGAFLARRVADTSRAAVSNALDRLLQSYAAVAALGRREATYSAVQARVLYETLHPQLFAHGIPIDGFPYLAADVEEVLRDANWDDEDDDSAPEADWPTWQQDLLAKVRGLTPAGVLYARDAVGRAIHMVQRGMRIDAALVESGLTDGA